MNRPRAFVADFAGTASVSLRLLGSGQPLTGYMGSKRAYAVDILGAFGLRTGMGTDHLVLTDAGPWGDVWTTLTAGGWAAVADTLRGWADRDPFDLWVWLRDQPMPEDAATRAAAYLWLQARAANSVPVWWNEGVATSSAGSGKPCQKGGSLTMAEKRARGRREEGAIQRSRQHSRRCNGVQRVETIARRVEALGLLSWPEVTVLRQHATSEDLARLLGRDDLDGVVVYQDPPYLGCTPYAVDCPRERVLDLARDRAAWGASVAVSEAVALPLDGWHAVDITRKSKPEWLTMNVQPSGTSMTQMNLWLEP